MGKGIALQAKQRFPHLAKRAAQEIEKNSVYGFITLDRIGLFQVKHKWYDRADLSLICLSTEKLFSWIMDYAFIYRKYPKVVLNFPGIGNGKLERLDVLPFISLLPDCVEVWEYDTGEQNEA